jgi:RNA polymerase sigma-70 factor (ECF subfamily)
MTEDKLLLRKLRQGKAKALCKIYEKYKNDLLALAMSLCNDSDKAEDALHDVFVAFARRAKELQLRSSLKGYLLTSIANRVRNFRREPELVKTRLIQFADVEDSTRLNKDVASSELVEVLRNALAQLPFEQQEVITLHLMSGLKFREIAAAKSVSINTIQSRYRYGLEKLKNLLNGQVNI